MKVFLTIVLPLLIGFISLPTATDDGIEENKARPRIPSELNEIVRSFWDASLSRDNVRLDELVTVAPDNFYAMYNKCSNRVEDSSRDAHRPNDRSDDLVHPIEVNKHAEKILDSSRVRYLFEELQSFASRLREDNYVEYYVDESRISGNHAIIRFRYGKKETLANPGFFLLTYRDGNWRIFSFSSGYYLLVDNRYFAQSSCEETPITELPWKPIS